MRHAVIALAAAAVIAQAYGAEARPRFRFSSPAKAAPPARDANAATGYRPGLVVAPAIGAGSAASSSRADIPTGSVAPAPAAPSPAPPPSAAPVPEKKHACAPDRLFGAGAGFCTVN